METILIVDDEKNYPLVLSAVLEDEGYETLTANSGPEALDLLKSAEVDLVLTDMKMPGMNGIELLSHVKAQSPDLPVIMMTAYGTVDQAVEAMQKGAYSYILKPFDNDRLTLYVKKAVDVYRMIKAHRRLLEDVQSKYRFGGIIGKSEVMQQVFRTIHKVAPSSATVLIEGESGTGKELVAKSIHYNSPRKEAPIVAVNCSALAETLLESELFGHEKGAFTGAVARKKGRFELADGGTLFLDEIGELSPGLQVKLLRCLQERAFERVGGEKSVSVDIRVIAATNKRLMDLVRRGTFREDLFYRLNVVNIVMPPLRQRQEDIRLLVAHFIAKYSAERKGVPQVTGLDPEVERLFFDHGWPGNVRELENVIERAMVLCAGEKIGVMDLPKGFRDEIHNTLHLDGIPADAKLYDTLVQVERQMIFRAMRMADNVQAHAADLLGIGKSGLNQKLKKHNIEVGSKP